MSLTELEISLFQKMLEEEKMNIHDLAKRSVAAIIENGHVARSVLDRGEKARIDHDLGISVKVSEDSLNKLKKINSALRRVEKRTFGSCVDCHGQIHLARLESMPWEPQCITCKQEQENEDALTRSTPGLGNYFGFSYVGDDEPPTPTWGRKR